MQKKFMRFISICLVVAALLNTAAYAVSPNSVKASEYISSTTVASDAPGNGVVKFAFSITATDEMPEVGVRRVEFYRAEKQSDGTYKSVYLTTYYYTDKDYEYLMAYKTGKHSGTVSYQGIAGQEYFALVTFYAGESGVGGDVHTMNSGNIKAK